MSAVDPPVLLLDVMSTLVRDPYVELPGFFGMSLRELLEVKHPTSWHEFERGEIDEARFIATFFSDGRPVDGEGMKAVMRAGYAWLDGIEELLGELRSAGVEMHALSNYAPWYDMIEEELRLSRYLTWSFVSCDTGVRKPDPESYLGPARALRRPPGGCLFVDDQRTNCVAAEAVGMPAIRFESAGQLRRELRRLGVPAPGPRSL